MNRRDFFRLAVGAAGTLLIPELLAPRRTFFLPPIGGWQKYDYVSIALGYQVTYQDIADNLYQQLRPGVEAYWDNAFNADQTSEWGEIFKV